MIDPTLQEKMLDAPLIIKGFVNGEPECNYELYLTELVNHSKLFLQKSEGEAFKWEEHQAHGECDAVSKSYSIDYKLFATRSSLQGLRETSGRITKITGGGIAFGLGRWPAGKPFTGIRTVAALRSYSLKDFNRIAADPDGRIEREISKVLKALRVKKYLLLFYPYTLMFSEPHSFESGCHSIAGAFNDDLDCIGSYRRYEAPGFDTYLSTIYEKKMLIFQLTNEAWKLEDFVEMKQSKIYMDLYYAYGNNGFNF